MNNYRYLMYSIALTILGFGLWIGFKDHEKILHSIQRIGWSGFLFICLFSLLNYSLRFVRWRLLLKRLGDEVAMPDHLLCYICGFALTTTPGKAGEAVRCLYFKRRYNIHPAHTLAAILSERTSDAIASTFLALMAIYSFQQFRWLGVAMILALAVVLVLINKPALLLYVSRSMRIIKIRVVQKLLDLVPVFVERSATLLSFRALGIGTFIAFFSWSAEAYGFAWLAHSLGGQAPTLLYMSIFAIGMIAGALSFLPGGLGSAEVVLYVLLKATGMGHAEALTVTLLCRLATLWLAVALGVLSILWLENNPVPAGNEG